MKNTGFSALSRNLTAQTNSPVQYENGALPQVLGYLWTHPREGEQVVSNSRGWQRSLSRQLGVSPAILTRMIDSVGAEEFRKLVADNPAGQAPTVTFNGKISPVVASQVSSCECCSYSQCSSHECGTNGCCSQSGCGTSRIECGGDYQLIP